MASLNPSASAVSCKPERGWTYDVFVSYRGQDTRNNFVDHLYAALVQKGIHAFKDDQMISQGKLISEELLKAIEESRFAVVVLSMNYANSSWCLEELAKIIECKDRIGLKVLPVFYHVDPSDVRKQKRSFATAFQEHVFNFSQEKSEVNKWKEALAAVGCLSGYHISAVSGGENKVIIKIVQTILGDMKPNVRDNNLIGIESHMDALFSLLNIEEAYEVRIIGIYGMGGIGKTTIARALCRRIDYKFVGSSFIRDVRENCVNERDICALQEKILQDILVAHHGFKIRDPEYGADMIKERLSNKKVLIVLDDVDHVKQLEFLAAGHDWFGLGSRIIITTRDEHLLSDADAKYKPSLLCVNQALELFCRHAFRKESPIDEFKELSNRAVSYTGRLPLALKVLGSSLHGRKACVWESALDRLATTPNSEIFETLKLSFDGLEESEKKIFLDIACFFKGKEVDYLTRVLDSFGFFAGIGITSLTEKSLINISKNRVYMHDLIQKMGWQVLQQRYPNSRLWKNEEIHDFIMEKMKLELVEAIVNPWQYKVVLKQGFSADVFKSMKNLRLLDVNGKFTCCEPTFIPHKLRWLRWNQYPFPSLPLSNMCRLVGVEIGPTGMIEHLWNGQKIMLDLKFIKLQALDSLSRFPDVSGAPNIERLILSRCTNLVEVHESVGCLGRLVSLDMNECWNLKRLPSMFDLESLEVLILNSCKSLERLPEFTSRTAKLSHINCAKCYAIQELPTSIRNVSNLSMLNLTSCKSLINIPNTICELKHFMTLSLQGCSKLSELPNDLGNMESFQELHLGQVESFKFHDMTNLSFLKKLDLSWNRIGDQDFPKTLKGFSSLHELHLSGNSKLMQLPASISQLYHLKHLDLSRCHKLQSVNGLPLGIQILDVSNCISLEVIKDLTEEYEWLNKIHLFGCKKLLEDNNNEISLDKMTNHFFTKKCAAIDGCLSVGIPRSKIPSWFTKQHDSNKITLNLPFKWQTQILGFAVCGVFRRILPWVFPAIKFRFEDAGRFDQVMDINCGNICFDDESENVWIAYVPFSLLENMHQNDNFGGDDGDDYQRENWSHVIEGNLLIELHSAVYGKVVRCGAQVVYKDDMESTQDIKPSMSSSYYWKWKLTHGSQNTIHCW